MGGAGRCPAPASRSGRRREPGAALPRARLPAVRLRGRASAASGSRRHPHPARRHRAGRSPLRQPGAVPRGRGQQRQRAPTAGITRAPACPMPPHGWARNVYWQIDRSWTRASLTAVVVPHPGFRLGFPFDFELRMTYRLEPAALVLDTEIKNTGGEPFPYALGFHPYLRAPLGAAPAGRARALPGARARGHAPDHAPTAGGRSPARPRRARTIAGHRRRAARLGGAGRDRGARRWRWRIPTAGLAARVSVEGSEQSLPGLGDLERGARRALRLPRALDRRPQRPQPAGHAHAGRGRHPPLPDDAVGAGAVATGRARDGARRCCRSCWAAGDASPLAAGGAGDRAAGDRRRAAGVPLRSRALPGARWWSRGPRRRARRPSCASSTARSWR